VRGLVRGRSARGFRVVPGWSGHARHGLLAGLEHRDVVLLDARNVVLASGSHALTCVYAGAGFFDPATSATQAHLVGPFATTTTVTTSPTTITYGASVTLTATVTSAVGVPPGR